MAFTEHVRAVGTYCQMCGREKHLRKAFNPDREEMVLCDLCAKGSAEILAERDATRARFSDPAYLKAERAVNRSQKAMRRNVHN